MTLITGLRCSDAVVLGSDSQITFERRLKTRVPKLFCSRHRIIWGIAGPVAAAQSIEAHFNKLVLDGDPDRESGRIGIRKVMTDAAGDMQGAEGRLAGGHFQGLFAWYSKQEARYYLLQARSDGTVEFKEEGYGAVGSSRDFAQVAFFGFGSSGFLDYQTLPSEAAKMLVHTITDDAINASAQGVDGPVQLAVVTAAGAGVLLAADLKPVEDTAVAFKMHQADFLKRADAPPGLSDFSGLDPDVED
jgi:20S proteasome alpha/beta subunit